MNFDAPNAIIDQVLTQEELDYVYSAVGGSDNTHFMSAYNQDLANFFLRDDIKNKLVLMCEGILGIKGLKLEAYQFARYQNKKDETGRVTHRPILSPHHDDTFQEPRFTFDLQLGGNTTWAIVVEGRSYELKNNQALSFAGTHQVHWREHKLFEDGEYLDMLFMHMEMITPVPIPDETRKLMYEKEEKCVIEYLDLVDNDMISYYDNAENAGGMHSVRRFDK